MPWCPKCRNEYIAGITKCADCGSELVDELPQEDEAAELTREQILRAELLLRKQKEAEAAEEADETASCLKEGDAGKKSNGVYKDNAQKAAEFKDSGYTLLGVGSVGLLAILLMACGVLPFGFGGISVLTYGVLGIMFFIFIVIGLYSMKSAKVYKKEALSESSLKEEILGWCRKNLTCMDVDAAAFAEDASDMEALSEEEKYFKRTEAVRELIGQKFLNIEEGFLDALIDEFYPELFGE